MRQRGTRRLVLVLVTVAALPAAAQVQLRAADSVVASEVPDISPGESEDELGRAVAVGDFNGDGFGDAAMGAPYWNIAAQSFYNVGRVVVINGTADGLRPFTEASCEEYYVGDSTSPYDRFGSALAVGDFDADGYDDLAVGAPGADWNGADGEGVVNVFSGSPAGLVQSGPGSWTWFTQDELAGSPAEEDDSFGSALTVGDLNGDGYDDLAVGVPLEDIGSPALGGAADAGFVHVVWGSASGLSTSGSMFIGQEDITAQVSESGDRHGAQLAAGDFNDDGFDDLAIAAPGEDGGQGVVFVLFGSAAGPSGEQFRYPVGTGVGFGTAMAAGDLNGDGWDDLAVGEPLEGGQEGRVTVFWGSPSGLAGTGEVVGAAGWVSQLGAAIAIGDLDGDGAGELIVGAPRTDTAVGGGLGNAGRVHVRSFGHGAGWQGFDQDTPLVAGAAEAGDVFGTTLATGDLNGDLGADVLVGVPGEDWQATDVGAVAVLYFDTVLIFKDGFESGGTTAW